MKASKILLFGGLLWVGTGIHQVDSRAATEKPNFRITAKGMQLQQRGVPVSGVVLYQPTGHGFTQVLDEAGSDLRCNQDPAGSMQNETPIVANPSNTNLVLAGANDYRNGDASGGFYRSTDGGSSWMDALITRGPSALAYDAAGDPVVCIDTEGRMYAAYIAFEREAEPNGLYVQTSTDSGQTWSEPVAVCENPSAPAESFEDKPYAVCDINPFSPYANTFYVTWTKFGGGPDAPIYFSRSINGGQTFRTPQRLSESSSCQFSCPAVGPFGEVYVVWYQYGAMTRIRFVRSLDGGETWDPEMTIANCDDDLGENPCGSFRTPSYPVVSCDISNGPRRGWIYVSWVDNRNANPDVYFCRSTDGGDTWSAPQMINDDGIYAWQWWQWIVVHPQTGEIGLSWLDRREDLDNCLYRAYATTSTDGGFTWTKNFPISSMLSDPTTSGFLGDYCGTTFRDNGFYSAWTDLRRGDGGDCFANWWNSSTLSLTSPNGGERWYVGQMREVSWYSAGLPGTVAVELNREWPSGAWETLFSSTMNDCTETWQVTGPATTHARLRITCDSLPRFCDSSEADFEIAAPSLTLTAPVGSETLAVDDRYYICWLFEGVSGELLIELNRSFPSEQWEPLTTININQYRYQWLVTGPASTTCRMRILSVENPSLGDTSDGDFVIQASEVSPLPESLPNEFAIAGPYPNPFNATAVFRLSVPHAASVRVKIYDVLGREVSSLFEGMMLAGYHEVSWYGGSCASGIYFVSMRTSDFFVTRKALLLK
jgi:hypothetical protein